MVKEAIQKTTPLEGRRQCKKKLTYGGGGGRMSISRNLFHHFQIKMVL